MDYSLSVFSLLLILGLFKNGNALECYKCTSDEDQICLNAEYKDSFLKIKCTENACLTVLLPMIGGMDRLARDCYKENYCDKYSVCKRCEGDLCNNSNPSTPSLMLVLIIFIVGIINI